MAAVQHPARQAPVPPFLPAEPEGSQPGQQEQFKVETQTPAGMVKTVETQFLTRGQVIIPGHLGQTSQPGQHPVPLGIFRQGLELAVHQHGPLRSRSDKSHLPEQDVHQLRQLVQGGLPQEAARLQHPLIPLAR